MPAGSPDVLDDLPPERRAARRWLGLSLGVLVLAGLFALAVVIGRMPPFDRFVTDPLFFKRCLIAHVNLALVAWFYSFVAALLFLLPSRHPSGWIARHSVHVAAAGVLMLLAGAAIPESRPLLSNYIPTIDHPIFRLGQITFGLGVLSSLLDRRLLPGGKGARSFFDLPEAARTGLRAAALALVLAAVTFAVTWFHRPDGIDAAIDYDLLVWGGGHVLQLVSTVAMVTVWLLLLTPVLGFSPVSGRGASALFLALVAPWMYAPLLAMQGSWSPVYRIGFTRLMQWCLLPVAGIFLILCARAVLRAFRERRVNAGTLADPRMSAFLVSAALTLLGFGLGAAIRGSNTMVPAHYHASVGAVTVSFMAAAYVLLPVFGLSIPAGWLRRAAAVQPALYGSGMLIFASGFALAGAHGMGRKIYGAEQAGRGLAETIGLSMMGIGGFVAIGGGVLFLLVVAAAGWRGAGADRAAEAGLTRSTWRLPHEAKWPG